MQIISQRDIYLENRRKKAREFHMKVIALYNKSVSANTIAKMFTNPLTGKPYSRGWILSIIAKAREGNI